MGQNIPKSVSFGKGVEEDPGENLLLKFLVKGESIMDRTDLETKYDPDLADFVMPDQRVAPYRFDLEIKTQTKKIDTVRGPVDEKYYDVVKIDPKSKTKKPPDDSENKILKCAFPVDKVDCDGEESDFRILIYGSSGGESKKGDIHKVWKGKGKQMPEVLLNLMRDADADSFDIAIFRELVQVKFNKEEVISDAEAARGSDMNSWPKCWVIIGFTWGVLQYFKMVPEEDGVLDAASKLLDGNTKEQVVKEAAHSLHREDMDRLVDLLGPGDGIDYKHFIGKKAEYAPQRSFKLVKVEDFETAIDDSKKAVVMCENCSVDLCVSNMLDNCRRESGDEDNWKLMTAWEPFRLNSVEEYIHHLYQQRVRGKIEESEATAIKTIDFLNQRCQGSQARKGMAKAWYPESLQQRDILVLFDSARKLMERTIATYEKGDLTEERFEEQFKKASERMVVFCDKVLIPMTRKRGANGLQDLMWLQRMKADFLRQLCSACPKFSDRIEEAKEAYNQALEMRWDCLSHWDHAIVSSYVNAAIFAAECWRNRDEAIRLCMAGQMYIADGVRVKPKLRPSPAAIFTHSLLESNRTAFASWIVLVCISFKEGSLNQHLKCVPKPQSAAVVEDAIADNRFNWRECAGHLYEHACVNKAEVQAQAEEKARAARELEERVWVESGPTRAIKRWLRSRPLHSHNFKHITSVRWIDAIEDFHEDHFSEIIKHQQQNKSQSHEDVSARRASALPSTVPKKEDDSESKYLMACVVLPRKGPSSEMVKERMNGLPEKRLNEDAESTWTKELQNEFLAAFKAWPKDERDVKDIVRVQNLKKHDWIKLEEALDDEGMIKPVPGSDAKNCSSCGYEFVERLPWCSQCRQPRPDVVWKIAGTILYPGDTLLQDGDNGTSMDAIKKRESSGSIFFISHMRVSHAAVMVKGAYTDFHTCFKGYRNGSENIGYKADPFMPSLHAMSSHISTARAELKKPKPASRRIGFLSARKDPIEASGRGCF